MSQLSSIGLKEAQLAEITKAEVVEIDIPYEDESLGWEVRIFPWEFLLFTATGGQRSESMIVIRHVYGEGITSVKARDPKTFMVVESAPGDLDQYSFDSERRLVESNLKLVPIPCPVNPTLDVVAESVKNHKPDVIHLAGIDAHQGMQLLNQPYPRGHDGYFLADATGKPEPVDSEQLAPAINGRSGHHAVLVSCNFYNSAARVAALIAAQSALAAIGFQDEIEDRVAEDFFAKFYFNWRALDWDLLRAFRLTIRSIHLGGAIVVLWSTQSLLAGLQAKRVFDDSKQVSDLREKPVEKDVIKDIHINELLDVKVRLKETVNYSLLQNNQNLFEEFSVRKLVDGRIRCVNVEITLFVGSDSFPYRREFDMEESIFHLADEIRFPLTSELLRSIRESVTTVVAIKVSWRGNTRYLNTHQVKLLAIDEWVDTPELDAFLPSFVFPRDRAVAKIINAAQHYLMAFNDDIGAGFDGYQGVDPQTKDPYATVDLQARAIWSALSYDLPLAYINPPPTFTASSQRLRTPTDVIDGHRGTCIDLALLLAACFEYVGIYPVVFLLKDHAFPGYWRSEESRQRFVDMRPKPIATASSEELGIRDASVRTPIKPWIFTNYTEITQLARAGDLVPIESVWLTQQKGFWDSVDEGMNDLRSKSEFSSMIDIQGARTFKTPVTPLPIMGVSL